MSETDTQLEKIRTIIKSSRVNFLIGAGASVCELDGKISYPLMKDLLFAVRKDSEIIKYYDYLKENSSDVSNQNSMVRLIFDKYLLSDNANIEEFISILDGMEIYVTDGDLLVNIQKLKEQVRIKMLNRIKSSDNNTVIEIYKSFYNGLRQLRELNSFEEQSFSVFTTNYDMLNEMAMESLGIHYYSGFEGIVNRRFNMSYYNCQFVHNYNVNKSKYLLNTNHINLYKLHGSISWKYNGDLFECNPYENDFAPEIIYPSVAKFENTNLITYYSALMRAFSNQVCKADSVLIVIGTSLNDEHINKIIENALSINTFTLIIFAYGSEEIDLLKYKYNDFPNVIIYEESMNLKNLAALLLELRGVANEG